jgi:precorrin-6Y C5,15-methyltransferase (decarboxylating)
VARWLTIVGMGEDGFEGLSSAAQQVLKEAEAVIGSKRLLSFLPELKAERHEWPQPFNVMAEKITSYRGRRTVILATGDPMNYGVARKLFDHLPFEECRVIPHLSAFSLAAARLGWSLPDCDTLSLHGRPVAAIEPFIQPDVRLIALTADGNAPADVAQRLVARGYGSSIMHVLENLGGKLERISNYPAQVFPTIEFSDLNLLGIECRASPDAALRPRVPGLPDDAFIHDGQLTKREVRAATLAALAPTPDALLWDVGAGCGSVAIEWMRAARGTRAIAFERDGARRTMIAENMDRLGAPMLKVIEGEAPASLANQPAPDAVFIGGGLTDDGVFEAAWVALKPQGRLVANVVTLEGEARLIALHEKHGGEIVRIEVSHLTHVGDKRALRPRMAVTQWRATKP